LHCTPRKVALSSDIDHSFDIVIISQQQQKL
jgi:hypothetical protein